jgi:hypothetical protein
MCLKNIRKILEELKEEKVIFKNHFYERTLDRSISENLVRSCLKKNESLIKAEKQQSIRADEEKYKLWFKLSRKYALVIIIAISKKNLYIITGWNKRIKWIKKKQE